MLPTHDPEPDDHRLVVLDHRITACPLPAGGTVALGRDPGCEIALDDAEISPLHARLTCDRLAIEDLGSAAGTWVRGARLAPGVPAALSCDEVFQLGSIAMVVQRVPRPARPAAPTGGPTRSAQAIRW